MALVQAKVLSEWTGAKVGKYWGGETVPTDFDILVSTPKAFQIRQAKDGQGLSWEGFRIVVFDEVHHVLKDHPYRHIAHSLKR